MIGMMFEKVAMTSVFNESEKMVPVTVLKMLETRILGVTSIEKQGYAALRVAYGLNKKDKRKVIKGIFGDLPVAKGIVEFRLDKGELDELSSVPRGSIVSLSSLQGVTHVDARAKSVGRGYQGVVKRHGMSGGPESHGSHFHRKPGSIGMCADPGRVFKGRPMPGQMGDIFVTAQNLKLFSLDMEEGLLLLEGSIPGRSGALVRIRPSIKKRLSMKIVVNDGVKEVQPKPVEVVAAGSGEGIRDAAKGADAGAAK